jgi:hypothetical protein
MAAMASRGMMSQATFQRLENINRADMLVLDKMTHFAVHQYLSAVLNFLHGTNMRNGPQQAGDWSAYLDAVQRTYGPVPKLQAAGVMGELGAAYQLLDEVMSAPTSPCAGTMDKAYPKFRNDAAQILEDPAVK